MENEALQERGETLPPIFGQKNSYVTSYKYSYVVQWAIEWTGALENAKAHKKNSNFS